MENVMNRAWEIARKGQQNFGGNVKQYFAEALKISWKVEKGQVTLDVKSNEVVAIKSWFVSKNFNQNEQYGISVADYFKVVRETEKAYFLEIGTEFGKIKAWAPKSVCMTQAQVDQEIIAEENRMNEGLKRNQELREMAISMGIKGIRKRMKTSTLERKIAEHKAA